MNIAIDFDGVLFDTESIFRALSEIYNLKIGGKVIDKENLRFQDRYDWTPQQCKRFIDLTMLDVHKKAQIMPCAKNVINALKKYHKVYAITSRGVALEEEIEITNNRLKQEGIEFEQIIYSSTDKLEDCKKLNIDLMIEDWEKMVSKLADNGIKCLHYRDNILTNYTHSNITTVRDWGEIAVQLVNMGLILPNDID